VGKDSNKKKKKERKKEELDQRNKETKKLMTPSSVDHPGKTMLH
jgi:hypothetical protein